VGEFLEIGSECLVAQKALDECSRAGVLLLEEGVLGVQGVGFLDLDGDFAFELDDVFWEMLVEIKRW
jgi:hypothetical protein